MDELKYVVVEIQTYTDGKIGSLVTGFDTYNEAASKYHTVLAAAAMSKLPVHAAVLLDNQGGARASQYFTHEQQEEENE